MHLESSVLECERKERGCAEMWREKKRDGEWAINSQSV